MNGKDRDKDKEEPKKGGPAGKKSYVVPTLLRFGPLTLLTGKAFAISIT